MTALVSMLGTEGGSTLSLGGLEEALNIRFSNPPCEEKLRRLFPASLIVSLVNKDGGGRYGDGEGRKKAGLQMSGWRYSGLM